ncbi:MAG: hypothetical protein K2H87_00265, partial [Duncaniella sp.]|nr:hypothetical protein [Duncaniella sp.]
SGMPTFQISPSYPSTGMYRWIGTVMGLGLPSPAQLPAMMMVGFFILLMTMGMRWYVSLAGAIAYGFSTYFIIIIGAGHIWKFVTLAYIPPTIAGIILCYRGRYLAGAAMAALFGMMQIAGNHVQMSYYFLYVILGIVVAMLVNAVRQRQMPRWWKATASLAVAAILAVGANLPSLYNTYEYSKETMRGRHSELTQPSSGGAQAAGLDKDYITQYSYQPSETFSLVIPNIKGGASARPEGGRMTATSLADTDRGRTMVASGEVGAMEAQYLGYLSQYFGDPEGTNGPVYVGALIFALFLLGAVMVKGSLKWALVVLTLFSILLAWGRHAMVFTDLMLSFAPMYSKFRTVESILVIAEFTIPLLAMMGLQKLLDTPAAERGRWLRPAAWCLGITALICLLGWAVPGLFGSAVCDNDRMIDGYITRSLISQGYSAQEAAQFSLANPAIWNAVETLRYALVKADSIRSLIFVLLGAAVLWFFVRGRLRALPAALLVAAIVGVDLYTVNKRYLSHTSFVPASVQVGAPIAMTPADRTILADTTQNYRVMDIPRFYSADPSYYHKMVGGYHAAKLTRYQDLIDRHLSHFTDGSQNDADWNVLNMLNARYIVDMEGNPILNPEAMGNAWFVDTLSYVSGADAEMAALSHIDPARHAVADRRFEGVLGAPKGMADSTDYITETTYAPHRLTYRYRASAPRLAVFSEVYFPWGWRAEVDGEPVELGRVDYVLRAAALPAGEHTLTMTFDPRSLHTTDTLARISVILIYIAAICAVGMALRQWRQTRKEA